jgi:hypothetical protein
MISDEKHCLGIMQPYFFPYIGYLQLVHAVDTFVFYDDVNFIKKGWIHRNQLAINGQASLFSIPLKDMSQNKKINEIYVDSSFVNWREKFLKTLEQNYKKAPFFAETLALVERVLFRENQPKMSELAFWSIEEIAKYVGITTKLIPSSAVYQNEELKAQERIIAICEAEKATTYLNPIGGKELYNVQDFKEKGMELYFLRPMPLVYSQGKFEFIPWLSTIDVLMHHSAPDFLSLLTNYTLE